LNRKKQTGIFVDRFFHNFSYADLAKKYDMTEKNAKGTFHNSVNRVLAVIEATDNGETVTKQVEFWKDRVKARTEEMPKGQKWYLLNKLLLRTRLPRRRAPSLNIQIISHDLQNM